MDLDARGASAPWSELPTDALSEIAGHLHDAGDLIRFLAVCRRWREAPPPARSPTSFLPCLVEPCDSGVRLHSPFSTRRSSIRPLVSFSALRGKRIERSDASSGRALATGGRRTAELINPLNGDATALPPLPRSISSKWRSKSGVVSRGGVVVFHTEMHDELLAALLRPGELHWEEVDVTCSVGPRDVDTAFLDEHYRYAAALWSSTVVLPGAACAIAKPPQQPRPSHRYVVEFHGELLCVDVVLRRPHRFLPGGAVPDPESVSVQTMQVGDEGWPRWVERKHTGHLCLFLDWKGSFAVDAREFAGSAEVIGGCAYYFSWHPRWTASNQLYGVYRYSLQNGTATLVDELPTFFDRLPMWSMPRPRISWA
nr:unnamed protein product [Digitaria exilis]